MKEELIAEGKELSITSNRSKLRRLKLFTYGLLLLLICMFCGLLVLVLYI